MSISKHAELVGTDIHHPFRWICANETERLGIQNLGEEDKYCLAIQTDDNSVWMLIDPLNTTWKCL